MPASYDRFITTRVVLFHQDFSRAFLGIESNLRSTILMVKEFQNLESYPFREVFNILNQDRGRVIDLDKGKALKSHFFTRRLKEVLNYNLIKPCSFSFTNAA